MRIGSISLDVSGLGGFLGGANRERVVGVVLSGLAEAHAAVVRHRLGSLASGVLDVVQVGAADPRGDRGEAQLHHLGTEAERLDDLGAAIARDAGDSHLGHDLQQSRLERLSVARRGFIAHGRERQVGMDRRRADGDQAGEVVHIDAVAGDGHDVGCHSPTGRKQMRVHGADRERHRHGQTVQRRPAVAQGDDPFSRFRLTTQSSQCVTQGFARRVRRIEDHRVFQHAGQLRSPEHRRFELEQFAVDRDRRVVASQQLPVRSAFRLEAEPPRSNKHAKRHDSFLAQRIDRGVGDLRETLAEVSVDASWAASEWSDRDVIAHRVDRFGAGLRHHVDDELHILESPAMERVLRGEVIERFEVDVVPFHRDEDSVGEQRVVMARGRALLRFRIAH